VGRRAFVILFPEELPGRVQFVLYREGVQGLIVETVEHVRLGWGITGGEGSLGERIELPEPLPTTERPIRIASLVLEAIEKRVFFPHPGWRCLGCPFRDPCREMVVGARYGSANSDQERRWLRFVGSSGDGLCTYSLCSLSSFF
jgi:hypothetical protein